MVGPILSKFNLHCYQFDGNRMEDSSWSLWRSRIRTSILLWFIFLTSSTSFSFLHFKWFTSCSFAFNALKSLPKRNLRRVALLNRILLSSLITPSFSSKEMNWLSFYFWSGETEVSSKLCLVDIFLNLYWN